MIEQQTVNVMGENDLYELNVTFDVDRTNDVDPAAHPDNPAPERITILDVVKIKYVELVINGVGTNITSSYLDLLQKKTTTRERVEFELCALIED